MQNLIKMASRDRDLGRKYECGSAKRKKIEKRKHEEKKFVGSLTKYFQCSVDKVLEQRCDESRPELAQSTSSFLDHSSHTFIDETMASSSTDLEKSGTRVLTDSIATVTQDNERSSFEVSDPCFWPVVLTDYDRTSIVKNGPVRSEMNSYPSNENGRHFSNAYYTKTLVNGEKQDRRWLLYSKSKDAVYCFACRLFSTKCDNIGALASHKGVNDWKHLSDSLKSHENGKQHKECMMSWFNLYKDLSSGKTIDAETQAQIASEQQRWRDILERLLAIINFLASHNLAFRGHDEDLSKDNSSGNFLDLVKLISRFDPVLREHVSNVLDKPTRNHYLSKTIQNELIEIMALHVKNKIIEKVKNNKYYSIILDCTRDISRVEQMTIILRTTNQETAEIEEYFLEFVAVEKTTAEMLSNYIINLLKELGLSIADCRGQGYDNGSNMRGEKSGVQRRLLDLNPLAFFVPCGCHSWNLVLGDAASSCSNAKTFFGILQRLYTIFSCSSERWSILKSHVSISLKPLSETRWECRSESVKAVRYQLSEVSDALSDLREKTTDCQCASECESLENEISTYEFVLSLVIWYDILIKIHTMSKVWQSEQMQLDTSVKHVEVFVEWIDHYRENGFHSALVSARDLAEEAGIEINFKPQRVRRKKKMFNYEQEDETLDLSPEENFRLNYFLVVVDAVRASCKPRFSALKAYKSNFGFMYNIKRINNMSDEELMRKCKALWLTLSDGDHHDIDALELFEEIKILSLVYEGEDGVQSVLKYIAHNNLKDVYPNVFVTLRIITTIPVTVASAERSFSKLKLIKTYLRNSMTQDRLSSLALLSIENELISKVDFKEIIEEFSRKKSRRISF